MNEETSYEILEQLKKQNELLNKLVLLIQTDIILRESLDLSGRPRTPQQIHQTLADGYRASLDYAAIFDGVESQKMREQFNRLL